MPRAGWCRECREWVWVDAEGACPHGHDADAVSHHYEAHPRVAAESADGLGRGQMPPEVNRFNWGAFLVPVLWGAGYRVWHLVAIWAFALLVPITLSAIVAVGVAGGSGVASASAVIGVTVASDVVVAYIRLWAGANANRLLWERESKRLEADPAARPRMGVALFLRRQRAWVVWGAIGAVLALAISYPAAVEAWKPYGLQSAALAEPVAFLAGQILLGLWLARQMRLENPSPTTVSGGAS